MEVSQLWGAKARGVSMFDKKNLSKHKLCKNHLKHLDLIIIKCKKNNVIFAKKFYKNITINKKKNVNYGYFFLILQHLLGL